jgi:hypothetical protein
VKYFEPLFEGVATVAAVVAYLAVVWGFWAAWERARARWLMRRFDTELPRLVNWPDDGPVEP